MKRFIVLILVFYFVFGQIEVFSAPWSGKEDDTWYSSSQNLFYISTPEELAGLSKLVNKGVDFSGKTINLTENIDLAGIEWTPIGDDKNHFRGTFDGNYNHIKNLNIDAPGNYAGLFAYLKGDMFDNATIKNLGVSCGSYIKGNAFVGAIVACNDGATVENCFNLGAIEATDKVGGIVGVIKGGGALRNCFNSGAIEATDSVGGLVGVIISGIVENSYNTGDITANSCLGGLVGADTHVDIYTSIQNCYNTGIIKSQISDNRTGGILGVTHQLPVNSYYLRGTSDEGIGGGATPAGNLGLDAFYMQTPAFALELNNQYNDIWVSKDTYPVLDWEKNVSNLVNITATVGNKGGRIIPGGIVQVCGSQQRFEIVPEPCYEIKDVIVNGHSIGKKSNYSFSNIVGNETIEAIFENIGGAFVTSTSSFGGRIYPSGDSISICEDTRFVIIPDDCYIIDSIFIDSIYDASATVSGSYTFKSTIRDHHTIHAVFKVSPSAYTITTQNSLGGRIEPFGSDIILCSDKEFTITPDECYVIDSIFIDNIYSASATASGKYMFSGATSGQHSIKAKFITPITIIATAGSGGSISPKDTLVGCAEKTFYFTPAPCHVIDKVIVNGEDKGALTHYTFDDFIQGENTVQVTFKPAPIKQHSILITTSGYGAVIPDGLVYKTTCDSIKINIKPDSCKIVKNIFISEMLPNGVMSKEIDIIKNYDGDAIVLKYINTDYIIHIVFSETGYTEIFSEADVGGKIFPEGFLVGKICEDVVYHIQADDCYAIKNVYIDGKSIGPVSSYTFKNVSGKHNIFAEFTRIYKITAKADTGGVIVPEGKILGWLCSDTTIKIIPDSCNIVDDVIVDGRSVGPVSSYTFKNISKEYHTISAKFKREMLYLNFEKTGDGYIYVNGYRVDSSNVFPVEKCSEVEIYIVPYEGNIIWNISVDGEDVEFDTNRTVIIYKTISTNKNIRVEFIRNAYVMATASLGGTISPAGKTYFSSPDQREIYKITPNKEFAIEDVLVDSYSIGEVDTYEFTNVTSPRKIHAEFIRTFTITSTAGPGGTISPEGTIVLKKDATQDYIITPDAGYKPKVFVNGMDIGDVRKYTLTATKNHIIHVDFELEGSISEQNKITNVLIHPNPASSNCTISAKLSNIPNKLELLICDMAGQQIMKFDVSNLNSEYLNYTFSTDKLVSGAYNIIIRIDNINNNFMQKLIIKK